MRTTVTLEPDVLALVRAVMKERGLSFQEAVNSALRAGLTARNPETRPFIQQTYALGRKQNFRWDKALEVAASIENEEIALKLALRK